MIIHVRSCMSLGYELAHFKSISLQGLLHCRRGEDPGWSGASAPSLKHSKVPTHKSHRNHFPWNKPCEEWNMEVFGNNQGESLNKIFSFSQECNPLLLQCICSVVIIVAVLETMCILQVFGELQIFSLFREQLQPCAHVPLITSAPIQHLGEFGSLGESACSAITGLPAQSLSQTLNFLTASLYLKI